MADCSLAPDGAAHETEKNIEVASAIRTDNCLRMDSSLFLFAFLLPVATILATTWPMLAAARRRFAKVL
ncbi:hypothetical protein XthCFBP4691_15595 [Xanthomonas theicola]|uniref:Uncharacterized protein n=1 Tax=Xanthomonas theicola TaxID=56464 RepID=A0A2S6ZC45_9XANT|nr:hypothetical protein [Xanthomonas theicola]PPT87073.1 hypothetical protein XthCFBP4691_15595 [Xanthomonas theicola]QNH23482.1 hypothetical protein G4Q83_06735 [Xanthomonas theicola]